MNKLQVPMFSKVRWGILFLLLSACVDIIDFNIPPAQFQFVIEGMISDNPGFYTVKISRSLSLDADSIVLNPVIHAKVKLFEDQLSVEELSEVSAGVYSTSGAIQGKVGHSYFITIETEEGRKFESVPEKIEAVGEIKNINYQFEARKVKVGSDEIDANVFKISVDANVIGLTNNYVRWRYTGTYKIVSRPELHETWGAPLYAL